MTGQAGAERAAQPDPRRRVASSCLAPDWPTPRGVRAATTLRGPAGFSLGSYADFNLGAGAGDDPAAVAANRAALVAGLSLPSWPHWLRQVHGMRVLRIDAAGQPPSDQGLAHEPPEADASATSVRGVVLAILSADCLPVLLAAKDGSEVAAAHAGWRGLACGVIESAVASMHARPEALTAWIGPGIGGASYEVDARVRDTFVGADAVADLAFIATRPGHWLCDLGTLARQRLRRAGVSEVHGGAFDTFRDERFYSYRREGAASGRMATLIWRE